MQVTNEHDSSVELESEPEQVIGQELSKASGVGELPISANGGTSLAPAEIDPASEQGARESLANVKQADKDEDRLGEASSPADKKIARRPLSAAQIATFVNLQVPANKRVLCLIVRDKVSRLNRAKSHFHPTYYLFIQTIANLAELGQSEPEVRRANNLSDNSSSASSSMSADMVLVGSETGTGTPNLKLVLRGRTSYSDNADSDLEQQVSDELGAAPRAALSRLGAASLSQERPSRQDDTSDSDSLHGWSADVGRAKQWKEPAELESLWENEKNPFSGTYGVLLSGRKRKKTKT